VRHFAPDGVLGRVDYLVAHEVQMSAWEPLGVIQLEEWDQVGIAIARLE
jgi:hypothetical protein